MQWKVSNDDDIKSIASSISRATHHAEGKKHWQRNGEEWARLGVIDEKDYRNYIAATLKDKETKGFKAQNDRQIFYNHKKNIIIIIDPKNKDNGTCYRPEGKGKEKEKVFAALKKDEAKRRNIEARKTKLKPEAVRVGTYRELNKPSEQSKEKFTGKQVGKTTETHQKKNDAESSVEKHIKERDLDIKKSMIKGNSRTEATKEADKKLLNKLTGEQINNDLEKKIDRKELQDKVKEGMKKNFGDEGLKKYEEKLIEERKRQEELQKQFKANLNNHQTHKR